MKSQVALDLNLKDWRYTFIFFFLCFGSVLWLEVTVLGRDVVVVGSYSDLCYVMKLCWFRLCCVWLLVRNDCVMI